MQRIIDLFCRGFVCIWILATSVYGHWTLLGQLDMGSRIHAAWPVVKEEESNVSSYSKNEVDNEAKRLAGVPEGRRYTQSKK